MKWIGISVRDVEIAWVDANSALSSTHLLFLKFILTLQGVLGVAYVGHHAQTMLLHRSPGRRVLKRQIFGCNRAQNKIGGEPPRFECTGFSSTLRCRDCTPITISADPCAGAHGREMGGLIPLSLLCRAHQNRIRLVLF